MKTSILLCAVVAFSVMLSACDSSDGLLEDNRDFSPLTPEEPTADDPNRPRPPADEAVMTTTNHSIVDVAGEAVQLRGVNLQFADDTEEQFKALAVVPFSGSNVVRIELRENTQAGSLEAALNRVVEQGMVALVTFVPGPGRPTCERNAAANLAEAYLEDEELLIDAVEELWLKEWLPVLAQRKFQPYLMLNIASKWGPRNVFNESSLSYGTYMETYNFVIGRFRAAGFKVPLVIDAPGCGTDFNAFMGDRARELKAADKEANIVLSVHAFDRYWNSSAKLRNNFTKLYNTNVPFVVTEFGGSGVGEDNALDHLELMEKAVGDKALSFNLPWETPQDKAAYSYVLPQPLDFTAGVAVSFDVYLPRDLVDDGKFAFQTYLRDATGKFASIKWETMGGKNYGRWTSLNYSISSIEDIEGWTQEGFSLSGVSSIGFELNANGKAAELAGEIMFDNIRIEMAPPPEPIFLADFTDGNNGFVRDFGAGEGEPSAVTQSGGELVIHPTWGAGGTGIAAAYDNRSTQYIDLSKPFTLMVDIFVPEEYQSDNMEFQFFVKDANWNFAVVGYRGNSQITRGQVQTIPVVMEDLAASSDYKAPGFSAVGSPNAIGFEIRGVSTAKSEGIRLDNFRIYVPSEGSPGIVYLSTFDSDTEGFAREFGAGENEAAAVTQGDGELLILPTWGAGQTGIAVARNNAATEIADLAKPFTLSFDLHVPESYTDEALAMQLYVRDATDKYHQIGYWSDQQILVGETQPIRIEVPDILEMGGHIDQGFVAAGVPSKFGFEIKGITSAKSEPIRLDNFEVTVPVEEEEVEIALDLTFEAPSEVAEFTLDFFEGAGWMESSLAEAKSQQFGIHPFGWLAWSWMGNSEDFSEWDMVTIQSGTEDDPDPVYLPTERGIEIIEGPNGIAETAEPVNFPTVAE